MSWYGTTTTKQQLDALIDKKPKLHQLFSAGDLVQELKSYNPKLLEYISNTPDLIKQAIGYLTIAPRMTDSNDRKHKFPLLTVQVIQTQATCILNSFFKEQKETKTTYYQQLFRILTELEILPLLAGYFFRVNLCLLNNRFKQTTDKIYNNPSFLYKLLSHCQHMAISNTIQLFLNLDANKSVSGQSDKLTIKMQLLGRIIGRIANQSRLKGPQSPAIVQNLTGILIETIQKYYLISDGKQMLEVITGQSTIDTMLNIMKQNTDLSYSAANFFIALINYYSYSSLNSDEAGNTQQHKKNQERLDNQPMIVALNNYFPKGLDKIMNSSTITLQNYRLLEVLCHLISISSIKILSTLKQVNFFGNLIALLFKHEKCNILHMLIEKAFLHIFISERSIYDQYKKHLFCEIDIINLTANRFMESFPDEKALKQAKKKGYFGHFMRILKIYSGIQTNDEKIVNAIKAKTQIWNKISKLVIKPYQTICYKDLGSYYDVPEPTPLQFAIKKLQIMNNSTNNLNNTNVIEQINRQQSIKNMKHVELHQPSKEGDEPTSPFKNDQQAADSFFKTSNFLDQTETSQQQSKQKKVDMKKSQSFKQFLLKKKAQAETQIRMQRSLSTDKKLSGNKAKMTSPSPKKKNSWKQEDQQHKLQRPLSSHIKTQYPKIPMSKKAQNTSLIVDRSNHHMSENQNNNEPKQNQKSHSLVNMQDLKKIRVIQIEKPAQKKYRRMQEKDKLLLDFLGIAY